MSAEFVGHTTAMQQTIPDRHINAVLSLALAAAAIEKSAFCGRAQQVWALYRLADGRWIHLASPPKLSVRLLATPLADWFALAELDHSSENVAES